MLNYDSFKDYIKANVLNYFPDDFSAESVQIDTVIKNNNTKYDALIIRGEDINICPTIYLNSLYEEYSVGQALDMDDVYKRIVDNYTHHMPADSLSDFAYSYDNLKDKIIPVLLNKEMNSEYLVDKCCGSYADLAVVYKACFDAEDFCLGSGTCSITITNNLMKQWNISFEQLDSQARDNLLRLNNASCKGIVETIMGYMGIDEPSVFGFADDEIDKDVFVITNGTQMYGCSCILDDAFMDSLKDKLGEKPFIIPCSVHELIAINSEHCSAKAMELVDMIKYVNATELKAEDVLSDNLYSYDFSSHQMHIANGDLTKEADLSVLNAVEQAPVQPLRRHGR